MFAWFRRRPERTLKQRYDRLMKEARDLQRGGDIPAYAEKTREAEDVWAEIEALRAE